MLIINMKNSLCILIISFSFILIGCGENSGLMNYKLKEIEAVIKLPNSFKPIGQEDVLRAIDKKKDPGFKNGALQFQQLNPNSEMLIDTVDPYKFIMISKITPYAPIDSNSFYFLIDRERSRSSSKPDINDSTYYVGSKMGAIGAFKFIESKYKRTSNNMTLVVYSYMITSDKKSTGIAFYGPKEQDVRVFVNSIKKE
jgi:hypothetical protein